MNGTQKEKAAKFLSLHKGNKILILPNIWDPLGARILQSKGYPAAATASAAISSSLGYQDGEKVNYQTHLRIIKSIAQSVEIPVTADIEGGYATDPDQLERNIQMLLETGAAGINIEDSVNESSLRSIEAQCERISLIRRVSDNAGIHLVINARTDYFLLNRDAPSLDIIKNLTLRAHAFYNAGADCIYPVGLSDLHLLRQLRKEIPYPINVLGLPSSESISTLQETGINRISFGPFVYRSVMKKFINIINELYDEGNYSSFAGDMLSKKDIDMYLRNTETEEK